MEILGLVYMSQLLHGHHYGVILDSDRISINKLYIELQIGYNKRLK
jgi:hypothetical protein